MPSSPLVAGTLDYRIVGPDETPSPSVVFVHGFLTDSRLWDGVAELLAERGVRSYLVDWPLGSHRTPMPDDADLSPAGVANIVGQFIDAVGLTDATLVGNDSGGAICQLLVATQPPRIGRLVLTNCDAFENFPPPLFVPLFQAAKHPWLTRLLMAPMRLRVIRHSFLGYGLLLRRPRDAQLTRHWITAALTDGRIRHDIARFARGVDRSALVATAPRLRDFPGTVRIAWGTADRAFPLSSGRRLAEAFADAELVEIPDASTFVPVDRPAAVADAILAIHPVTTSTPTTVPRSEA